MAQDKTFGELQISPSDIAVRKITPTDLLQSLREGLEDFNASPSFVLFLMFIYPLFALLFTLFLVSENLRYLAFPIIAGLTFLGPLVSIWIFEISRQREAGHEASWRTAFRFVHSHAFAPILALSIVMMLLYLSWLYMAQLIFFGLFGSDMPATLSEWVTALTTTRRGGALAFYGIGVGAIFAFFAFAISVVAFPLLLDRPASFVTAMVTSMRAVLANAATMALWGLIVVVALILGALLFLIGLGAILPILGHATWHLYRKVIEP